MKITLSCSTLPELKIEIEKLRKLYPMAKVKEPQKKAEKYYKAYILMANNA